VVSSIIASMVSQLTAYGVDQFGLYTVRFLSGSPACLSKKSTFVVYDFAHSKPSFWKSSGWASICGNTWVVVFKLGVIHGRRLVVISLTFSASPRPARVPVGHDGRQVEHRGFVYIVYRKFKGWYRGASAGVSGFASGTTLFEYANAAHV
jgi:hypothetical protein